MKIFLLLLSTLALSSIVLAVPTIGRDKKLLEALLGEKDDNLALEQDMDPDLPPYQPSGDEKKDALALLQAMKQIAKDQFIHFHFHGWVKEQDDEDDNSAKDRPTDRQEKKLLESLIREKNDDGLALEQDMDPDLPPYQPSGDEKKDALALLQVMKKIAKDQFIHFHFHGWVKEQDDEDDNSAAQLQDLLTKIAKAQ